MVGGRWQFRVDTAEGKSTLAEKPLARLRLVSLVKASRDNTDSDPFKDVAPAISLRENERGIHVGNGWALQWHQPTDLYATYDDKDFRLGLNAAQTTLSAVALLAGATVNH